MKLFAIFSLFIISCITCCAQEESANRDTSVIFNNITDFMNPPDVGRIFRSYDIKYTLFERNLDTTSSSTISVLDSLSNRLRKDNQIVIEIGIHLTIKHSDQSSKKYDHMYTQIIDYLVKLGVDRNQLMGKNYLAEFPIITFSDKSKFSSEKEFWETEWNTNNRVEFKIISK